MLEAGWNRTHFSHYVCFIQRRSPLHCFVTSVLDEHEVSADHLCSDTDRVKQKYSSAINVTHMTQVSNPDLCGDKPH